MTATANIAGTLELALPLGSIDGIRGVSPGGTDTSWPPRGVRDCVPSGWHADSRGEAADEEHGKGSHREGCRGLTACGSIAGGPLAPLTLSPTSGDRECWEPIPSRREPHAHPAQVYQQRGERVLFKAENGELSDQQHAAGTERPVQRWSGRQVQQSGAGQHLHQYGKRRTELTDPGKSDGAGDKRHRGHAQSCRIHRLSPRSEHGRIKTTRRVAGSAARHFRARGPESGQMPPLAGW